MVKLRKAEKSEIEWVNDRYREVGFVASNFETETLVIAEYGGEKAGLGRLVKISPEHYELGGMYVLERFRGMGIAAEIVPYLLEAAPSKAHVWCLPYAHLHAFYEKFGFKAPPPGIGVPVEVSEKLKMCNLTSKTLLYYLRKP